jgi:hypothetical protein
MTINDLITIAASGYPDKQLAMSWDKHRQRRLVTRDPLADFIVAELHSSYRPRALTTTQLKAANARLTEIITNITQVQGALCQELARFAKAETKGKVC